MDCSMLPGGLKPAAAPVCNWMPGQAAQRHLLLYSALFLAAHSHPMFAIACALCS